MPIFDQGYQHWQGERAGHAWRWLVITRQGVRMQWRNKLTRYAVISALGPALALAGFLTLWGLLEQQSELIQPILDLIHRLPEDLVKDPGAYRLPIWTFAFYAFFKVQVFFSMILVLLVGPDLISQDLRFNAIPLYFSRPLRRVDYFLGKLGVIATYLAAVTIGPLLLAYGLGVGFSLDLGVIRDTAGLLAASLAYNLVVVIAAGTLMLGLSALSKNSRLVGAMWMGIWLIGHIASQALDKTAQVEWAPLLSFTEDLRRLNESLLGVSAAWESIQESFGVVWPRAFVENPFGASYPWQWAAYTLAGLGGLSLCMLSFRVRSLDRLR